MDSLWDSDLQTIQTAKPVREGKVDGRPVRLVNAMGRNVLYKGRTSLCYFPMTDVVVWLVPDSKVVDLHTFSECRFVLQGPLPPIETDQFYIVDYTHSLYLPKERTDFLVWESGCLKSPTGAVVQYIV